MKRFLPIISIVACMFFVSCSKALTDIGYAPAPIGTVNATQVPIFHTTLSGSYYTTSMAATHDRPSHQYYNDPYERNTNMGGIDNALVEKTAKKDCISFIKKFLCVDEINSIVDSLSTGDDKMGGWKIFTNKGFEPEMKFNVSYDKEAWFKICSIDNPQTRIYVQMIVSDISKKPLITGIRY